MVLLCWVAGLAVWAGTCYLLNESMEAATLREAGWPFGVMYFGGFVALMWPWLLAGRGNDPSDGPPDNRDPLNRR
jgi:hypothetical protein